MIRTIHGRIVALAFVATLFAGCSMGGGVAPLEPDARIAPNDTARFVAAGFFSAVHRHLAGEKKAGYFDDIVAGLVEKHGKTMVDALRKLDGHLSGPDGAADRRRLMGVYALKDIWIPSDFATRLAELGSGVLVKDLPERGRGGKGRERGKLECGKLRATITRIEVQNATPPAALADNVAITWVTVGQVGSPNSGRWPPTAVGDSQPIQNGREATPNTLIGSYEGGNNCDVAIATSISLWEVDAGQVDRALRETAAALLAALQAANLAMMAQVPVMPAPGLIDGIVNWLLDKLGLSDDWMGSMNFWAHGQLTPTTPLANLSWTPGNQTHRTGLKQTFPTDQQSNLNQLFEAHRGKWKLHVIVQRQ